MAIVCRESYAAVAGVEGATVLRCHLCHKPDVVVVADAFGVASMEPHFVPVASALPRRHLPECRGEDGKVEDCVCRVVAA